MREIKFRCWDNYQKKYIFTGFHVFGEVTCFNLMDQVAFETFKERGYNSSIEAWNDFEIEQFVGVQDKTKIDVYEGDIVKNRDGYVGEVLYSDKATRFGITVPKTLYGRPAGRLFKTLLNCEILGNKHENEELL
jgi:hypothetical protein